jgi:hypothetical protein
MKKIITLLLLMMLLTSCFLSAQTKDTYLLKSKHQKTAAWIMLGGGTTLFVIGGVLAADGLFSLDKTNNSFRLGGTLAITGVAAMFGSIPLFIASSRNKHRAIYLSFANQRMPALVKNITGNRSIPSISLQFSL